MEPATSINKVSNHSHDKHTNEDDDIEIIVSQLPKARNGYHTGLSQYQGFWFRTFFVPGIIRFQRRFQANDDDIILTSNPKSGTTWLKALLFSVVNRGKYTVNDTPLLFSNPHKLVPILESNLPSDPTSKLASPRLLSTHVPYTLLPETIKSSGCRVVYACRNPFDTLLSYWHFAATQDDPNADPTWTLEDYFDGFCRGEGSYGPFWDHVLGFWRASLERPDKILFLKYEDMKEDIEKVVKRLAEFVGFPFSDEEQKRGVVREICEFCSLGSLKDIQAKNKPEDVMPFLRNEAYFRNGQVGNWVNELSPQMVERLEMVIREKLKNSGLVFRTTS